jgi:hypothetical protein
MLLQDETKPRIKKRDRARCKTITIKVASITMVDQRPSVPCGYKIDSSSFRQTIQQNLVSKGSMIFQK